MSASGYPRARIRASGLDLRQGRFNFPAGGLPAEVERECQFRQLRGLKLKPAVPQPAPRSVDSGSDSRQKYGSQKHDRYDQQGRRGGAPERRRKRGARRRQDDSDRQSRQLPRKIDPLEFGRPGGNAGAVDHDDAESHDREGEGNKEAAFMVHGAPLLPLYSAASHALAQPHARVAGRIGQADLRSGRRAASTA